MGTHRETTELGGVTGIDRTVNGRRVGEWYHTATYAMCSEQPDADVLRDSAAWGRWCQRRIEEEKAK